MAMEVDPPKPFTNKMLEQVVQMSGRPPSSQPTHLSVPNGNHHRILTDQSPGYVAPKFEGKEKQMEQGRSKRRSSSDGRDVTPDRTSPL